MRNLFARRCVAKCGYLEFLNYEAYIGGAFGDEYTLLDTDLAAILVLTLLAILLVAGLSFAAAATFKARRKIFPEILLGFNLMVLLVGYSTVRHTSMTTDLAILQKTSR